MPESPRLAYPPPANIFGKHHSWKADVDLRQTHTLDCSCKRPHAVTVTVTPALSLHMQVPDCLRTTWSCFHFLLPCLAARSHKAGQSSTYAVQKTKEKNTMSSVKSRRSFNTAERWVIRESSSFSENTKTTLVLSADTTETCEQGISILCSHRINTRFRRHCPHAVNRYFMFVLLNTKYIHRPIHYITSSAGVPKLLSQKQFFCLFLFFFF